MHFHIFGVKIHSLNTFYCPKNHRHSWYGLTTSLFANFLLDKFIFNKISLFLIISSLFLYFNLFVSIFIQSYVNIKLHVSTLYTI